MRTNLRRTLVCGFASLLVAAPFAVEFCSSSKSFLLKTSTATAHEGGGSGRGGSGSSGGGSGSGSGHSGSGSNSGHGGADDDHDDSERGANDGDHGHRHRNGPNGEAIEIDGEWMRIIYPDGWKEEIKGGVFQLKDPAGRTVIERRATPADRVRVQALGL